MAPGRMGVVLRVAALHDILADCNRQTLEKQEANTRDCAARLRDGEGNRQQPNSKRKRSKWGKLITHRNRLKHTQSHRKLPKSNPPTRLKQPGPLRRASELRMAKFTPSALRGLLHAAHMQQTSKLQGRRCQAWSPTGTALPHRSHVVSQCWNGFTDSMRQALEFASFQPHLRHCTNLFHKLCSVLSAETFRHQAFERSP